MKRSTQEWVEKAESDFAAAVLVSRSRMRGRNDQICFHAQQCVEKYLKARLNEGAVPFRKVHDLLLLLQDVAAIEPLWIGYQGALAILTQYAVMPRYPSFHASAPEARRALLHCRSFRAVARVSLGLKP